MHEQNNRPWIILITHGRFGEELKKSAEMIVGAMTDVYCFSLVEGMDPIDLTAALKEKLNGAPENTVILTDFYGGTPSNVAARFATEKEYTVICGLNLSILIEAEMIRYKGNYENLSERILSAGVDSVKNITEMMKVRRGHD
ncbi:hypothetical protein P22_1281 [Propionispora sp. 2/2-37]|uniref:PTS sugar transporter subunit IIA n=1 Tax=Propionispora sp. 2/2-37 TaxID=1677858 RepID=UPI0006BB8153|nr:PTS fructose transporter subunit IIA [Propionispora sp. 2/2-37]CUH95211.1 hypothetical protein P22_1281 [Propionispora sp. 2/2-37]